MLGGILRCCCCCCCCVDVFVGDDVIAVVVINVDGVVLDVKIPPGSILHGETTPGDCMRMKATMIMT